MPRFVMRILAGKVTSDRLGDIEMVANSPEPEIMTTAQ
jgi:hypothetical protein